MTHDRTNAITDQFEAWLRGYSPPRSMENDLDRQNAEKLSLLRIVLKFSPMEGYERFVTEALDACAMLMKTRAWPTQNELGSAFRNHKKENQHAFASQAFQSGWTADPAEIAASKMQRGDAVGEGWLYGIAACEMIARKLVDQQTMTRYRSAAFHARRMMYGEPSALEWEVAAKDRHEKAKDMWKDRHNRRSHQTGNLAELVNDGALDHVAY